MKDVAAIAGVSQGSVSNAYNRPAKLSVRQRQQILTVARELGYHGPNVQGRSLRSGKIGAIGLMMMDKLSIAFADSCTVALMCGISDVGELKNVALTPFPLSNRRVPLAHGKWAGGYADGNTLAARGLVDGLIISTLPDNHPAVSAVIDQGIPFVVVDAPLIADTHFVGIDDRGGARAQMRHMLDLGHRKIGVIMDRLNPDGGRGEVSAARYQAASERIPRERLAGYLEVAAEFGLEFSDLQIVEAGGFDAASGRAAALSLLSSDGMTGIVACSDVMAIAFTKTANDLGLTVPDDLSVIGFDDIPEAVQVGLTTISQPMVEKGIFAAKFLIDALNAKDGQRIKPKTKIFPTRLVVRSSTQALHMRS